MVRRYSWLVRWNRLRASLAGTICRKFLGQVIEENIDHRRGVEGEDLAEKQAAHHGNAQWLAEFRANAGAECQRQTAEERGHGGHHNGTKAQQAGFVDRVLGAHAVLSLGFQSEVNHHDSVLFHDADEQDNSYERDDAEFLAADQQSQDCSHAGGGQRGKNRDGMDVTLVENAEHDVNGDERGQNQDWLVAQRSLERSSGALKRGLHAERHSDFLLSFINCFGGFAQRSVGSEIERDGDDGELSLVIY